MRIQDIADILIMTVLVYQLYVWFRKTRAFQVVIGLGSLALIYIVTKKLGLFMTSWILQELGTVIFVLIIVVFQGEIRQALYRFSLLRNFFDRKEAQSVFDMPAFASTVFGLAEKRKGALIVFERKEKLDDHLLQGVPLDSLVSSQLLLAIFEESSPLHDGAVIIKNGRITEASTHLPLSTSSELPQYYGTRHRAAIGLSERSDALVVVVSEERGTVSVVAGGELFEIHAARDLEAYLTDSLKTESADVRKFSFKQRLFTNVVPKFVTLVLVVACWILVNAKQGGIQTVMAQVKYQNLPEHLAIKEGLPSELEVQLKTLSEIFSPSGKMDITAEMDLSKVHEGVNSISVDNKAFKLPLGVSVVKVNPSLIKIVAEKKVYRKLPVAINKLGKPPKGVRIKSINLNPALVTVLGSETEISRTRQIYTEPIDFSTLRKNQSFDVKLQIPSSLVQIKDNDSVRVKVSVTGS
jgi:uncharacterized protein (TIGR00159 family)